MLTGKAIRQKKNQEKRKDYNKAYAALRTVKPEFFEAPRRIKDLMIVNEHNFCDLISGFANFTHDGGTEFMPKTPIYPYQVIERAIFEQTDFRTWYSKLAKKLYKEGIDISEKYIYVYTPFTMWMKETEYSKYRAYRLLTETIMNYPPFKKWLNNHYKRI